MPLCTLGTKRKFRGRNRRAKILFLALASQKSTPSAIASLQKRRACGRRIWAEGFANKTGAYLPESIEILFYAFLGKFLCCGCPIDGWGVRLVCWFRCAALGVSFGISSRTLWCRLVYGQLNLALQWQCLVYHFWRGCRLYWLLFHRFFWLYQQLLPYCLATI